MSKFKCSICDYTSSFKYNVKNHINKQIKCGEGIAEIIEEISKIDCEYCKKSFTTIQHFNRHIKICKIKKTNLEEENKKLKEKVEILESKLKNPQNVTINNNQTNLIINLAPWNDPKLPNDVEKYYREAVKKIFLAVPTLIKYIHFNSDFPENHNICIKNGRSKTAKVYNGKEWETIDEDRLIRTLIDDYEHSLEDYAEENNPVYLEKYQEIKDRDGEEKVYDDLHNEVKRVIYDRNHMVKIKK